MRVLAYHGPGRLAVEERADPHPGDGEVLLRVEACSICGTDLRIAAGSHRAYADADGRVPGHEVVGTVAESRSPTASEGTRVFVAPNYGCGRCRACARGAVNLCETPRAIGITEDGAFADCVLLPADLVAQGNLLPCRNGFDAAAAALAEPLACALRGSRACRIGEGDVVVVFGAGPIGLFHVALARIAGAAAVIVAAPAAAAQQRALELAGPAGRVNFFAGLAREHSRVELDTNLVHYKELVVTGTTASTNDECRAALDLILDGRVDAASLIDARFDLDSAPEAFELAGSGRALKVVIEP